MYEYNWQELFFTKIYREKKVCLSIFSAHGISVCIYFNTQCWDPYYVDMEPDRVDDLVAAIQIQNSAPKKNWIQILPLSKEKDSQILSWKKIGLNLF